MGRGLLGEGGGGREGSPWRFCLRAFSIEVSLQFGAEFMHGLIYIRGNQ